MSAAASATRAGTRWEPVIGLEVHVQLATASKMFCRCEARFGAPPNTLVCPVCTGQPGTLPVLNARALELGVIAGLTLGCEIDPLTKFDRKNYFYPDLPKGYQISQFDRPLCRDGVFTYTLPDGTPREISIVRAHLEEDSGKIIHPEGLDLSLVDLNRAGTPLLEIVSGPDLRSATEASAYLKDLRQALRYAGVAECDMEKGGFRCDVNISLRPAGTKTLGTRTETKNLNSFRFVEQALEAEIARQAAVLDAGEAVVQSTMAFDPESGKTRPMRSKEEAHDYRYFPEPDLPRFAVDPDWVESLQLSLPESPVARHLRYLNELGLKASDAEELVADKTVSDCFDAVCRAGAEPATAASWILNDLKALANARKLPFAELPVTAGQIAGLIALVALGRVSNQAARTTLLPALAEREDADPAALLAELDLEQVSDDDALLTTVREVLGTETELVARYRAGKTTVLNALLGRVMAASGGKANPGRVKALLAGELGPVQDS